MEDVKEQKYLYGSVVEVIIVSILVLMEDVKERCDDHVMSANCDPFQSLF